MMTGGSPVLGKPKIYGSIWYFTINYHKITGPIFVDPQYFIVPTKWDKTSLPGIDRHAVRDQFPDESGKQWIDQLGTHIDSCGSCLFTQNMEVSMAMRVPAYLDGFIRQNPI